MKVQQDYENSGYTLLKGLVPPEVAKALLDQLWRELLGEKLPVRFRQNPLLTKPAMELHGSKSPTITAFLWGLTPAISQFAHRDLLPTYAYFRLYQNGDKLRVHHDRPACEHSVSLTLGYSDQQVWNFDVGHDDPLASAGHQDDFGNQPFSTIAMSPGDAVLYRGIDRRHGRLTANPNQWSAHVFLHWVDRNGPYREHAFERWPGPPEIAE